MTLEMTAPDLDAAAEVARAAGNPVEALRNLIAANRLDPDTEREILIRDLRVTQNLYGSRTPGEFSDEPVTLSYNQGMPSCALSEVTPAIIRAAFADRGCLYIPNALDAGATNTVRAAIEEAQEACLGEQPDPRWYNKLKLPTAKLSFDMASARNFAHGTGGCLAADSPRAMFLICELYERIGLTATIEKYLGETPTLSASKFMLWRLPPVGVQGGWHQDGRFLGEGIDIVSLNVWTALTDCGESAPGMELVLNYPDHYITAPDNSVLDWIVSDAMVDELRKSVPVVIPRFQAGDMLMFDQWLLHRTRRQPGMTETRYAIESWFFAPSVFPVGRAALLA